MCRFEDLEKEGLLEYILQLSFAAHCKVLTEEINSNNCCGCQRDDPDPIEHDCLIMIGMDPWFDYYDKPLKRLDLRHVLQVVRNVCLELGLSSPDNRWEVLLKELIKWPMKHFYLLALRIGVVNSPQQMCEAILEIASIFATTEHFR